MIKKIMGVAYGRGARHVAMAAGPEFAPDTVHKMFPNLDWTIVRAEPFDFEKCMADRFGENAVIQRAIYNATPAGRHIFIGGDHSVNFGHFSAIADAFPNDDVCLVYVDAHLDIHTPQSSAAQASGAPHGANVRADLGDGDSRWFEFTTRRPALLPQNLFYIGTRAFEDAEINFVREQNIFMRTPADIATPSALTQVISDIRKRIAGRPFVISFDFDAIDPNTFHDVWVPEPGGISIDAARYIINQFHDAYSFEFVEYAPTGDKQSAEIVHELVAQVTDF